MIWRHCSVAGVDMASQEAYDLATSGLLRAKVGASSNHVIYGIKLIDFQLPEFVLGTSLRVCKVYNVTLP